MSTTGERLLAALRRDPLLFQEIYDGLLASKRADPWTPHPGVKGRWFRHGVEIGRGNSTVAVVWAPEGEAPRFMLRTDVGVGHTTTSVEEAFIEADAALEAAGWVLLPQPE